MKRVLVLLAGLAALVSAHQWSCFHGDPQHSGRSPYVVGSLSLSWFDMFGVEISGSPVVDGRGRILFGARDMQFWCLNSDGSEAWRVNLAAYGTNIYFSTPALDSSDGIYITTNHKLVKIDTSGSVLWSWPGHNSLSISHSPVIGQDGKIYFACYSDSLYALNPDSTLAWARPLGHSVNSAPAVGLDGNILVATTRDSGPWQLWSFKPNGDTAWSCTLAADADFASPAVGPDSTIYVGANRYLYAVRPDGSVKWRDSLAARIQCCPAVANESTLYVVAETRLYCIDTDSGVRWRKTIGGSSNYCSPAVDAEGRVYVGTADGTSSAFYCIGPDTVVHYRYAVSDDIWASPAIDANQQVLVACMNGYLYGFQGAGQGVAEQPVPSTSSCVHLWPNPTRGVVRIVPPGRYSAKVFDAGGSLVTSVRDADRIDLRGLRRGVYLVQVAAPGCAPQKVVLR